MAQLDFFMALKDKEKFVEFALGNGFYLIPDMDYETPKNIIIDNINDYKEKYHIGALFFIIHNNFFKYPLHFSLIRKNQKTIYFILQRYGGPMIDFYSPGLIDRDLNEPLIGAGFIGTFPYYWNGEEKINASLELMDKYKILSNYIRTYSTKLKLAKRVYWIGQNAMEKVRRGGKLVNIPEDITNGLRK